MPGNDHRICSETTLEAELTTVKETLMLNGYPESFIKFHSKRVDPQPTVPSVPKKRVVIFLPFKGDAQQQETRRQLRAAVQQVFFAADMQLISRTSSMPIPPTKPAGSIPATAHCL